ncbi:hypothetical protein OH77DRAFT_1419904 [Trametes cingulata]|nr:hypothetical protein OH77DRAFT_1419904 [Trametes cingulata]
MLHQLTTRARARCVFLFHRILVVRLTSYPTCSVEHEARTRRRRAPPQGHEGRARCTAWSRERPALGPPRTPHKNNSRSRSPPPVTHPYSPSRTSTCAAQQVAGDQRRPLQDGRTPWMLVRERCRNARSCSDAVGTPQRRRGLRCVWAQTVALIH